MKVADLTVDEFRALIKQVLHEELQDILTDPDKDLQLTDGIKARLQTSLAASERISFDEVQRRLNLI